MRDACSRRSSRASDAAVTGAPLKQQPQPRSSVAISVVLHVVLGVVLVRFLTFGHLSFFDEDRSAPVERIGFVALPQDGPPSPGISGGDGRPVSPRAARPPVAPTAVPAGVPAAPAAPSEQADKGGSGPLVGRGGPMAGIRPSYSEPRVWVPPAEIVTAPKTMPERLDSALTALIAAKEDSLKQAGAGSYAKKPGDWTWERGGKKYGWDQGGIRLGDFTIPSALLPKLAANTALNPAAQERAELDRLAREVREQGQRNMTEADFRKAVRSIRERKERERRDAEAMTARGGSSQR